MDNYTNKMNKTSKSKVINITDFKIIKTITENTKGIFTLLPYKDNKFAGNTETSLLIFDKDFQCEKIIPHPEGIETFCALSDETFCIGSKDKSIIIGDYTIKNAHSYEIISIVVLPNNRIASSGKDSTIKIWKSNPPYSDTPIKVIDYSRVCMIYCKERYLLVTQAEYESIKLVNMTTYQCVTKIEEIPCYSGNGIYQIDKDRVIVGGVGVIIIVNLESGKKESEIVDESINYAHAFLMLRDNKTILCACRYGKFLLYDIETKKYIVEEKHKDEFVNDLLKIDDETFITNHDDVKIWKY